MRLNLTQCRYHGLKWLWLSSIVIVLDQFTKYLVVNMLAVYESIPVVPFLNLVHVHNTGAAFSLLSDASGWQRWFFIALAFIVGIVIVGLLCKIKANETRVAAGLSLILGGAWGNVWDRIQLGYVIDFIDFYIEQWHWPAFNVADSAISIGAFLLILDVLLGFVHGHHSENQNSERS